MMPDPHASRPSLELSAGDHACCLYSTEDEHRLVFTEFIRRGLERGEKVWYAFETHDADTILSYLRDDGLDPEPYLESGQLVLAHSGEFYLRDGCFDAERSLAAFAEGYTGLCATVEMEWASDNLAPLSTYECAATVIAPHLKGYFVCQYDTRRFPPQHLLEEMANHPLIIAGAELCPNFLYVTPQDLVAGDRPTATLHRWLDNLVAHRNTDKALRDERSFHEAVLDSANTLIFVLDREGRIVELNETCAQTCGYSLEEIRGKRIWDVFPTPDERAEEPAHFAALLEGRTDPRWERQFIAGGGQVRTVDWSGNLLRDGAGEVEYVVLTGIDVTEQRHAENFLRIERDLGLALRIATDITTALEPCLDAAIAIAGMDCGAVYTVNQPEGNAELVLHVGLSPTFVAGASHYPADGPNARVMLADEPVYFGAENPCPLADVQEEGLSALAVIPIKHEGQVIACLNVASHTVSSVSETARRALQAIASHIGGAMVRLEAEVALRQDRADLQTLFDTMDDMVFVFDRDGCILQVNKAACRHLGYTRDEFAALSLADVHASEDRAQVSVVLADFFAGIADRCELPRLTKDGFQIPVETRVTLGRWGDQPVLFGITRDMTERKQAEQMQRLTAVGQLAAGVAHEFNNLLAAMMMGAEVASQGGDERAYRRLAEVVMRSTKRGADICRNLIAFARPREPKRAWMTIEQPIKGALQVVAGQLQSDDVKIERSYDTAGHNVHVDSGQLEQVFLNLFINASHAMPSGGTLRVETRHIPSNTGPGQVQVKVSDTGLGIAPEGLPRVFEPFFTTKGRLGGSDIPGTGLGLSVSHGIVQAHGGQITVRSTVGIGTTFELRFAASGPDVPAAAPPQLAEGESPVPAAEVKARILVVDDEPDVCAVVIDCLSRNGYEVVGVGNTHEALALVDTGEFDLIISDLMMPGGGGKAVLQAARELPAPPPVIVMTGRIEDQLTEEVLASGAGACLGKPFHVAELREMVAQLLCCHSEDAAEE